MKVNIIHHFLLLILLLGGIAFGAQAQRLKVSGYVLDENNKGLDFVNIVVENTTTGTITNTTGYYEILLEAGTHKLSFQYVGYEKQEKTIDLSGNLQLPNLKLNPVSNDLAVVEVRASEDPAYKVIREAIKARKTNRDKVLAFSCQAYIKGIQRVKNMPKSFMGKPIGDFGGGLDSTGKGVIYLSESVSEYNIQRPDKVKEIMISSKVSGKDNGFSYNTAASLDFNIYDNQIDINRPIISPIAEGAMMFYKYEMVQAFMEDDKLINKIKVTPKRPDDPAFNGFVYIEEGSWMIHSIDLRVEKRATKIDVLEFLAFKQLLPRSGPNKPRLLSNSILDFEFKVLGISINGTFTGFYKNYNLEPNFSKNFFNQEVLKVENGSNKKSLVYWDSIRPVKLSPEETLDYQRKDSIKTFRESKGYLDSLDAKNNKLSVLDLLTSYDWRNTHKLTYFSIGSPLLNIGFNTVQGYYTSTNINWSKYDSKEQLKSHKIFGKLTYGFADQQLLYQAKYERKFNTKYKTTWNIELGKQLPQFNNSPPISVLINELYSLFYRENYARYYQNYFVSTAFKTDLRNGLNLNVQLAYNQRSSVYNNSNIAYVTETPTRYYQPNTPIANLPEFSNNQVFLYTLGLTYQPATKYMDYPDRRFNLGSKLPIFGLNLRGGAGQSQFNEINLTIDYSQSMGLVGSSRLNLQVGTFFGNSNTHFIDYKHFNGNATFLSDSRNYMSTFQLLDYYTYSTQSNFAQLHYEHNFNGFILNKIPLIKRLGFTEIIGAHVLYTEQLKPYTEFSVGLDNLGFNIYRFFRFGWHYTPNQPTANAGNHRFVLGFNLPI